MVTPLSNILPSGWKMLFAIALATTLVCTIVNYSNAHFKILTVTKQSLYYPVGIVRGNVGI